MPYYSELGIYMSPTSSYTSSYIPGPYSNHSSLLASNFTRPPSTLLKPRNFRGYKPLLATITESQSPLRRINSPKLRLHISPKVTVAKPIKINTADIDVSVNKYRKYERAAKAVEERKSPESPRNSEKEAKPNKIIRRDRPTVRIQTIHTDMLSGDTGTRSWRDNFEPQELNTEEKRPKKTPGELLKEKFLIRSRENIFKSPEKKVKRASKKSKVEKTPSFHDICTAITTDQINEELNPGQPIEIQRRQSRKFSAENIFKDLKRNSADLNNDIEVLNQLNTENNRGSVKRKKKLTKKKSNEKVVLTPELDTGNKSQLQRRPTQKKIRRTSTSSSIGSDIVDYSPETEKAYQEAIRDISQVEIENIRIRPKPIITATVDVDEKPALKMVVDEIEVVESPKPKKGNKFKFNVIVEEIEEKKRRSLKVQDQKGKVHLPKAKEVVVSNVLRRNSNAHLGQVLEEEDQVISAETQEKVLEESTTPSVDKISQPQGNCDGTKKIAPIQKTSIKEVEKSSGPQKQNQKKIPEETKKLEKEPSVDKMSQLKLGIKKDEKEEIVCDGLKKSDSKIGSAKSENVQIKKTDTKEVEIQKKLEKTSSSDKLISQKINEDIDNQKKIVDESKNLGKTPSFEKITQPKLEIKKVEKGDKQNVCEGTKKLEKTPSKDKILEFTKNDVIKTDTTQVENNNKLEKMPSVDKLSQPKLETKKNEKDGKQNVCEGTKKLEKTPSKEKNLELTKKIDTRNVENQNKLEKMPSVEKLSRQELETKKNKKDESCELKKTAIKEVETQKKVSIEANKLLEKTPSIDKMSEPKVEAKSTNKEETVTSKVEVQNKTPTEEKKLEPQPKIVAQKKIEEKKNEENLSKPKLENKKIPEEKKQLNKSESCEKVEIKSELSSAKTAKKLSTKGKSEKDLVSQTPETPKKSLEETQNQNEEENFWSEIGSRESAYTPKKVPQPLSPPQTPDELLPKKAMPSKRSLVNKAIKDDPDLEVFIPPPEPEPEPEPDPEPEPAFVPLQSNRLSQFMHPFKKPEQFEECPIEIYATPKVIRHRHYPRPRHPQHQPPPVEESSSESEEETTESEEETSSDDEYDVNVVYGNNKVGASTSSNDSGFDSGVPGSRNKGSTETRDSPTSNPANNPALAIDSNEVLEEYSQSSTFASFQRSGRITPPATTIPRFRKYCVEDFNFLKVLGKGSFGKVLLAELKNTEYYYAIKCLKKDVVLEDDDVECTLIERKVLALATKHPYLCHLLCTFQTESHLFFVMEYLNGGDLMFHIQQSGRFPEARARFYGAEIVSGLKFLHNKGIVYRDLKLDNILLDFDGHVRIADFGMCKLQIFLDRMADTFCGTPDYMAPEIIKGQHYNQCVDWWSFGVLLYEMLLGQSPFSGCDEDELFWSICNEKPVLPRFLSAEASAVLTLFLEKDANKRLGNRFCPEGDIQDQPFFKPIQWDRLEARLLEPPFKPSLQHPLDTQYFDRTFTKEQAKLTPIEQNILQSMDQTQFQGFSYTNPNATDK